MIESLLAHLSPDQLDLLKKYSEAVAKSPSWLGLTATKERSRFWERHVLDSLAMLQALPPGWRRERWSVADVGTGNGVPGIPIAIVLKNWHVSLIDSDNKKIGFLEHFCNFNNIKNVSFFSERSETLGHGKYRETSVLAFSRALSKLRTSIELASPLVQVGGKLIVSHGTSWAEELKGSEKAMKTLNLRFDQAIPYSKDGEGVVLVFHKEGHTPHQYPRRPGVPARRPL